MRKENDPKIKLSLAIEYFKTKAGLADELGLNRATTTTWANDGMEFVPPLYAFRLANDHPKVFGNAKKPSKK